MVTIVGAMGYQEHAYAYWSGKTVSATLCGFLRNILSQKWCLPAQDYLKINVDGSFKAVEGSDG
jgi:hypothetical protein